MPESKYHIIPLKGFPDQKGKSLDKRAIAFWIATSFMLDDDSFYEDVKWTKSIKNQPWHYTPKETSLAEITNQFATLFENIVKEQLDGRKALLALSGGLDSRTLAVALKRIGAHVHSYSYGFEDNSDETKYGKEIARVAGWTFDDLKIPKGYLWDKIEKAFEINLGYAEFTHPRQIAVAEELSKKGDVFMLGHWGDVLFDDMGVNDDLSFEDQVITIKKKIVKKGGLELASDLWQYWGLAGNFESELNNRISILLQDIKIDNANARIRAFKSLHWATRWTSTNLSFFEHYAPIELPYYDDRMCQFICEVPEEFLSGRQIQMEYIKRYAPEIAAIPWQAKAPYNLFNHHKHLTLHHLPYRIKNKLKNTWRKYITKKPLIQRNWELQFLGKENDEKLRHWLFENPRLFDLVPKDIVEKHYHQFKSEDSVYWSHAVSMLLTLSVKMTSQHK